MPINYKDYAERLEEIKFQLRYMTADEIISVARDTTILKTLVDRKIVKEIAGANVTDNRANELLDTLHAQGLKGDVNAAKAFLQLHDELNSTDDMTQDVVINIVPHTEKDKIRIVTPEDIKKAFDEEVHEDNPVRGVEQATPVL